MTKIKVEKMFRDTILNVSFLKGKFTIEWKDFTENTSEKNLRKYHACGRFLYSYEDNKNIREQLSQVTFAGI